MLQLTRNQLYSARHRQSTIFGPLLPPQTLALKPSTPVADTCSSQGRHAVTERGACGLSCMS